MKRISVLIVLVLLASFITLKSMGNFRAKDPGDKYEKIMQLIGQMLNEIHYSPQDINDAFSDKIFTGYLKEIDPDKTMFRKSDIDQLSPYRTTIDDEINGAPVNFVRVTSKLFAKEVENTSLIYKDILSRPFDFTTDEEVQLDGDKLEYSIDSLAQVDRWRKKLKYMTLERYSDLLSQQEKNKGKANFVEKSNAVLEQEARDKVKRAMDLTFDRYRFKFSVDDQFNMFVNVITTTMDPHSEFFPPVDKRYFDEEMSGHFFGIGATLQYDDGNIKISSVITGSPAYKSGKIQAGDIIQSVAQGKEEPVDLTGYTVTDAVKLIRGKQGSDVRLWIRKPDGSVIELTLVRDEIVQDESYARSAIVQEGKRKIGYILLPDFYADFERPDSRRCYTDVAKEIQKLKDQNVDGIVFDLRFNGGGSLYDVVQMAGLFIKDGPIVQVKDRVNKPGVLSDRDKAVQYTGPLVVLVNEFSASASEIFAAAIQDYNRGIIIGSSSTYGKGTVQRSIGLDPVNGFSMTNADLGSVKLTMQKFYRINGGSTQLRGVSSDIVIPDSWEYLKVREKDNPNALGWDQIGKATYSPWTSGYDLSKIKQQENARVESDIRFSQIRQTSKWLADENERPYSLQLDKYKLDQSRLKDSVKKIESLFALKDTMDVKPLPSEVNKWSEDKGKQARFDLWIKALRKDLYINQGVKVLGSMIEAEAKSSSSTQTGVKKGF